MGIVWIFRGRLLLQRTLASIEEILYCGLSGCRVGHIQPLADSILVPHIVVVVEQIGGAGQARYDLDLLFPDTEGQPQAVSGNLDVSPEISIANVDDV